MDRVTAQKLHLNLIFYFLLFAANFIRLRINQIHTLGHSFSKSRLCTKAVLDVGDAVVSKADSVSELKEPAAKDQPLGKKLVTKHNKNYKR